MEIDLSLKETDRMQVGKESEFEKLRQKVCVSVNILKKFSRNIRSSIARNSYLLIILKEMVRIKESLHNQSCFTRDIQINIDKRLGFLLFNSHKSPL